MRFFTLLLFVCGLILFGCMAPDKLIEQPNILFISIDDLNDWVGPLGGNAQSLTPNLDRFAEEAVNFQQNYCTSPGCNPSRSTLMTGMHTFTSGMYSNYQDWRKVEKLKAVNTLGAELIRNGYYSAGAGKIFHYSQVDSSCWDDYFPSQVQNMPDDPMPPKDSLPLSMPRFKYIYNMFDWGPLGVENSDMGDFKSAEYISHQLQQKHDKPFFLACGIYRPHLPWYVPQKYFDRFPLDSIQLPLTMEGDTSDLGKRAIELVKRGGNYHKHVLEADQWKQAVQGYLASIAFADDMVGKLLESLANSAYANNTVIILWSDHGWQLGEKMHWRKFALWENVIRTLLMVKVPKEIKALPAGSPAGMEVQSLTSLLDLYPTIMDLCQIEKPEHLNGHSLIPLLQNPTEVIRRPIIITYDCCDYSVRYENWHYIRYVDDSEELYNLKVDSVEWHNIAGEDSAQNMRAFLSQQIPLDVEPLAEHTLIELMEHHIPPVKSKEYYFSAERTEWLKRFEP